MEQLRVIDKSVEERVRDAVKKAPRPQAPTPPPRRGARRLLALCLILAAFVALFFLNAWRVTVLAAPERETLAYPASFEEGGVTARLSGKWLFREGLALPVKTVGEVRGDQVGRYWLAYRADFLFWHDAAFREVVVADVDAPVITLAPETRPYVLPNLPYDDPGFHAVDNVDGDITDRVVSAERDGVMRYTVADRAGNIARAARVIPYGDPEPPVITLLGDARLVVDLRSVYEDPGYTAFDNVDGDITDRVTVTGTVNTAVAGYYTLTYTVQDSYRNIATASRTVQVRGYKAAPAPAPAWTGSGTPPDKTIYLTFDDGPGPNTNQLLDVLAKYNVKATFFVIKGKHTDAEMNIIAREAAEGHTVAIHSYSHNYKSVYASEKAYFDDLNAINEIIYAQTGTYVSLLRFPGGSSNTSSKFNPGIMTRLTAAVTEAGYRYFDWNVSSGDAGGAKTADAVYNNVISGCAKHNYSVVLQHDIKKCSVEAVERIIQWGLANGYTFLPLSPDSPGAHHRVSN